MFDSFSTIQAHPWHGISPGDDVPKLVTAFIELVPLDTVKYEIDKPSGHLKLDRPHKYSSLCPTLYGFIPRTYCGDEVAKLAASKCGERLTGDRDPLDICVLTENPIPRGGILVTARPVGGFRLLDQNEVDDKIIAVLVDDPVFGDCFQLAQIPEGLLDRLKHYFLTYKELPERLPNFKRNIEISKVYDFEEAALVISRAIVDYDTYFSNSQ